MNPRLRKVIGDIKESPLRAACVCLAILIGSFALSVAFGARAILSREVPASYEGSHPASITLWIDAVEPSLVEQVKTHAGVIDADARRLVRARVEVAPQDWRPLLLFGIQDFRHLRVSTFRSVEGAWPPATCELLMEQSAVPVAHAGMGGSLHIRVPGGRLADLPISGMVHDPGMAPGWQDNAVYAYVTPATLERLGLGRQLDELRVITEGSREQAIQIAGELTDWLTAQGRTVYRTEVPIRKHPHAEHMETMLLLLTVFSGLSLFLSGALVANVITALLGKQVRQIGIMKTLGAGTRQIIGLYLGFVLLLSAAGVTIGIPIGTVIARALARFAAEQLNLDVDGWSVPVFAFLTEVALGLGVPLVAAFVPSWKAARMTACEAIHDTGIQLPAAQETRRVRVSEDRRRTFALRNLFRRPLRLWLTLTALALGGAALMTALNVSDSLNRAVDDSLATRDDTVEARLLRSVDGHALEERVVALPGVRDVEAWGLALPMLAFSNAPDAAQTVGTGRYSLVAPPDNTRLFRASVVAGRWLQPDETGVIVVNRNVQAQERGLQVNRTVTLLLAGRQTRVRIVGIVEEVAPAAMYTNQRTLNALMGRSGLAGMLRIVTAPVDATQVSTALETALADIGAFPTFLMTRETLRRSMTDHFRILLTLLSCAALSAVIVGGLGLATSMSVNVVERRREIGILRAIGATPRAVLRLLLLEGSAIALASIVLAVALSLPITALTNAVIGKHGLNLTLPFLVSLPGIALWCVVATSVTAMACLAPARYTIRLPVQEVLAYE